MKYFESKYDYAWIIALATFIYLPFIGSLHLFDWDEINFAECAREMLITKDYLQVKINFQPFWEKPPLFIWMQVWSMKCFGVNEFAARFPNVICGICTLLVLYDLGSKYISRRFGWYWVIAYLCSILPLLYFKSGIIDPWFNLYIFISIWFLFRQIWWFDVIIAGVFIGLAILTKGPVALLLSLGTIGMYHLLTKSLNFSSITKMVVYVIIGILVPSIWFGMDIYYHGTEMTTKFLEYQIRLFQTEDAGHGGFFGYHFVVILLGCFPASIFAIPYIFKKTKKDFFADQILLLMQILFWIVLILFSIVKTKIVHYSSMCYIPLTFIAAYYIFQNENQLKMKKWVIVINFLYILGISTVIYFGNHITLLKSWLHFDVFTQKNLESDVTWSWMQFIPICCTAIGLFCIINTKSKNWILYTYVTTLVFTLSTIYTFTANIESISQRAAIDFYTQVASQNCSIETYSFKSYAHLFYGKTNPNPNNCKYLISKIDSKQELTNHPEWKFIKEKNGFVFWEKK